VFVCFFQNTVTIVLRNTNQLILVIEKEYVLCEEGKNRRIICYFLSKISLLWGEIGYPPLSLQRELYVHTHVRLRGILLNYTDGSLYK